ncbi:hypothetical protein [Kitasatospora sp. NPDC093806]|uniref:hypothetical protein n=1 Tax=Kitasatospora sp. NPDC093806 TaxID=3155075 RepID=UPI003444CFDF
MDLETMPRRSGRARAVALAGLVLAAATVLTGCGGGTTAGSDAAASGTGQPPASASASPGSPTGAADPSAATAAPASPSVPAPVTTPPVDPTATTPDPRPASPAPATSVPGPAKTPTPAATPPGSGGNGIAVGEPAPNGTGTGAGNGSQVHPAITYRVDGNRLTVWFYGGVCQRYALKADESKPGRVDVKVTVAAPVPAGQACADLARRQTVTADLKQALGGRAVTDLVTGQQVPLEADPKVGPDPEIAGTP